MGGSRRRAAKTRTKVSIKPRKQPFSRTKVPRELLSGSKDIPKKLGSRAVWDAQVQLGINYTANGFLSDCNTAFGRNRVQQSQEEPSAKVSLEENDLESDDDLRQIEGKVRKDGQRAKPSMPTTHQQHIIQRLLDAHGDDIGVCTS